MFINHSELTRFEHTFHSDSTLTVYHAEFTILYLHFTLFFEYYAFAMLFLHTAVK